MPRAELSIFVLLFAAIPAAAQEIPKLPGPTAPKDAREFVVSPAPAPVPLLKYRLFPVSTLRKPGNAVPIYLRFAHERGPDTKKAQLQETSEFLNAPSGKFDAKAARAHVDKFSWMYRQMDHAARKQTADWSYTLEEERENIFNLLLGDAQECRGYHRMLCLKARVETAEGKFEEAARTLETAFSMAEQMAQGPFLINSLIGLACGLQATDRIDDFITQPNAPNLYWSLLTLPRPMIQLRKGIDSEYALISTAFPELEGLDQAQGAPEFEARLNRVKKRFEEAARAMVGQSDGPKAEDLNIKEPILPRAKEYLLSRRLLTAEQFAQIPEAKAILLAVKAQWEEIRDQRFKALLLPAREARIVERAPEAAPNPPEILPFSAALMPWFYGATHAETRLERRLAALRLIEAVRMHAAANDGKLPTSLDEIRVVTVPDDPSTGRPFQYLFTNDKAIIVSPRTSWLIPDLNYTITLRK